MQRPRHRLLRRLRELEAERERLRDLIENNPDGLWLKDLEGVYRECNRQALHYLGKTGAQVVGLRDDALFPAELAQRMRAGDEQALRSGRETRSELALADAQGRRRELEILRIPLPAPQGGFAGVLGVARDIGERRGMERTIHLWAEAFRNAGFGLAIVDAHDNCYLDVNQAFAQQRGLRCDELIGQPVSRFLPPATRARYPGNRAAVDAARHAVFESEALHRDGHAFPVRLDVTVVRGDDGLPERRIVYSLDISERRRADNELRIAAAAFESQEGIVVTDPHGAIQRVNSAFARITGLDARRAIGEHASMLRSQQHDAGFFRALLRGLMRHGYWSGEMWSRRGDGTPFLARVAISAVREEDGTVMHYVGTLTDITDEREAQRQAERLARYDSLTELPNREHLRALVREAVALSAKGGELGALVMLDLDHFSLLNGAHGHQLGDLVLVALARRMRAVLRPGDALGRFAGDKFVVLMEGLGSERMYALHRASLMAEQLRGAAGEPFELGEHRIPGVGVSIGLNLFGPDGAAVGGDVLLAQAEAALERAKGAGRNTLRVFEPRMQAELDAHAHLVDELRTGIAQGQLVLYLQPQFSDAGRLVGAEALMRWQHPTRGLLGPDTFIALAEDNGLIDAVGRQALRMACTCIARWSADASRPAISVAVNVSPRQFRQERFVDEVLEVVSSAGVDPGRLKLELTESVVMEDIDETMARLVRLKRHGMRISLDDFGTGASSLSYLTRLPLDQLKIDQSFVSKLPGSRSDALVAQTILAMAKGLGLEVVAEGVETREQLEFLRRHGCDVYQGYLLGRAMPIDAFERLPACCADALMPLPAATAPRP